MPVDSASQASGRSSIFETQTFQPPWERLAAEMDWYRLCASRATVTARKSSGPAINTMIVNVATSEARAGLRQRRSKAA